MIAVSADTLADIEINGEIIASLIIFVLSLTALTCYLAIKIYRKKVSTGRESMVGSRALVIEWKKTKGRVLIQGETWHAVSGSPLDLKKDDVVTVEAIDELTLKIRTD